MKTRIFVDLALATSLSRQPFSSSCTQTLSRYPSLPYRIFGKECLEPKLRSFFVKFFIKFIKHGKFGGENSKSILTFRA